MVSKFALFSSLLLAAAALAARSSRLGDRFYRDCENPQSQTIKRVESPAGVVPDTVSCTNWAGACWRKPRGSLTYITGAFIVPTPSGDDGAASIWLGIDGIPCENILQAGIIIGIDNGVDWYEPWYEWYPEPPVSISPDVITVEAGDLIKVTIIATSTTSGMVIMENLTAGQFFHTNLTSSHALCEMNAEWIVEDYLINDNLVPFVNFGSVMFVEAIACGNASCYTPDGATLFKIIQQGVTLTSVSTDGSSVTINKI